MGILDQNTIIIPWHLICFLPRTSFLFVWHFDCFSHPLIHSNLRQIMKHKTIVQYIFLNYFFFTRQIQIISILNSCFFLSPFYFYSLVFYCFFFSIWNTKINLAAYLFILTEFCRIFIPNLKPLFFFKASSKQHNPVLRINQDTNVS